MSRIEELLEHARQHLDRVQPADLAREVADGAVVVDIRPAENREAEGELDGALVVERIVLEWRFDPTSPDRLPQADEDARVIVMCNEGYSSSLAAATLRELGVRRATDLAGGYRALREHERQEAADGPDHV